MTDAVKSTLNIHHHHGALEANSQSTSTAPDSPPTYDIEHMPVANDPRAWSNFRKNMSLALISSASLLAGLGGNIQNPAVEEIERDLPATSGEFSLSISLFILFQGLFPFGWSMVSELKGRRFVYLLSLSMFTVASIVVAVSRNASQLIGFRVLQSAGSSAVITIGAATLADIFEPAERGTKMGIYYMAPLLGPAIGPIIGGVLTTGFNWRAIFWFLTIVGGTSTVSFVLFFKDTFRRERSLTYQNVLKSRLRNQQSLCTAPAPQSKDKTAVTDLEKSDVATAQSAFPAMKLTLRDLNPYQPLKLVMRRWNNVATLFASGFLFAFGYLIVYTTSRTLSAKYNYDALKIGLVLLSYGFGCLAGSSLGGRWSDRELARLKLANGGISYPEMRLKSTFLGAFLLPPCILGFGWVCEQQVHVAGICAMLFPCGFFSLWTYSSTLAYIVDANIGRSSIALASNSAFRGIAAFIATEVAVPLQDGLGDGWLYTMWTVVMSLSSFLIILVSWKGEGWRESAVAREVAQSKAKDLPAGGIPSAEEEYDAKS